MLEPLCPYERPSLTCFSSIAFHPLTVIFETPDYAALLEKVGVSKLVSDIMDELLALAEAQGCKFPPEFKQNTINEFARSSTENIMWQDYTARRPMEVETYLGSPIRLSQDTKVGVPRVETLYTVLHNLNLVNRSRPKIDTSLAAPVQPGSPSTTPSPLAQRDAERNAERERHASATTSEECILDGAAGVGNAPSAGVDEWRATQRVPTATAQRSFAIKEGLHGGRGVGGVQSSYALRRHPRRW
jgi:hypothetical protein